ncbi:hypothetical protein M407DRAFT_22940 [Tulasnella calospora MUT 4182]|uniref:Uncharacterized protein n=1 Tax=Tulasnella calospora MUT 4182 TaxID=1051891 RepID=A0A0C3QKB2_9AGAM|nr:hypothetical protein M407DRAFT_22940 [Tulasnella calospora MUT 4182]
MSCSASAFNTSLWHQSQLSNPPPLQFTLLSSPNVFFNAFVRRCWLSPYLEPLLHGAP